MDDLETTTEDESKFNLFRKISDIGNRLIDYRMGLMGAGVMGGIVFGINYYGNNELSGASAAALKQAGYTFLFGGSIMRGCEYLATKIRKEAIALTAAIIIPSAVSIGLTYGIHSTKGTPKPLASAVPTAALVLPSTAIWGHRKRKQYNNVSELVKK